MPTELSMDSNATCTTTTPQRRCTDVRPFVGILVSRCLHFHLVGDPSNPQTVFGGYPYCFTVWEPSNFVDTTFQPGDWFVQAPNSTMNDAWCNSNAVKPTVLLPPHTAPLDFKFGVGSDSNMYAGLHGSWNRSPPQVRKSHWQQRLGF